MAKNKNKKIQFFSTDAIIFLVIFLFGFFIRTYGAAKINFTEFEAAYILGMDGNGFYTPSLLQNFVNKFIIQLPNYSPLAFRQLSVLAGSFIILLPYFLRERIGFRPAIICAFFFAIDPFLIANSILISGNTFVLLAAVVLLIAWIDGKHVLVPILFFSMPLLGRGFFYFFIALNIFLIVHSSYPIFLSGIRSGLLKFKSLFADRFKFGFAVLILFLVFLASSSRLDIFIADFSSFINNLRMNYPVENIPLVYPLALIVYIPLGLSFGVLSLILRPALQGKILRSAMIAGGIFLFFIMVFPGHRVIDLVWVSMPLWLAGAFAVDRLIDLIQPIFKKNFIFLIFLFVSISNLILSLLSLTYRIRFGLSLMNNLVGLFTIIVFIVTLVLYWVYTKDLKTALGGTVTVILVFLLIFQLSAASHTAGFTGSPEREVFWDGYYPDKSLVDNLIDTSVSNQKGTMSPTEIWLDREISPEIYWDLSRNEMTRQIADEEPRQDFLAIFKADEEPVDNPSPYIGQKFVAESYPAWMDEPLKSLVENDFWLWFFFRDSPQHQEYNYLWLSIEENP